MTGAGVGWMWSSENQAASTEQVGRQLEVLVNAQARGLQVELRMTDGGASAAVLAVSEAVQADLVVLSTHHATEDHTSVTEQMIARGNRVVLALHEATEEPDALRLDLTDGKRQMALVPTDLTPESRAAVQFAFELARVLPIDVHLTHFLKHGGLRNEAVAASQLRALVPDDLLARAHIDVQECEPAMGIMQMASALGAACIVMGAHTRSPLRRWLTRDTSRAVLHDVHCPVWYVPSSAAAA